MITGATMGGGKVVRIEVICVMCVSLCHGLLVLGGMS